MQDSKSSLFLVDEQQKAEDCLNLAFPFLIWTSVILLLACDFKLMALREACIARGASSLIGYRSSIEFDKDLLLIKS